MENQDPENTLIIQLATGEVVIELFPDVAPLHVERIKTLARNGEYDNVAFHRVIDDFVAQTGDVAFGDLSAGYDPALVGRGGSDLPDLPAEFSDIPFERAVVGMARSADPDSANSQFFIMFDRAEFLDGQYTVVGRVVEGMELVDGIKRGEGPNGSVTDPDAMLDVALEADLQPEIGTGLTPAEAREVAFLYEAGLDRDGDIDENGLNFWIDAREGRLPNGNPPASLQQIAEAFLDSPEFEASFGDPDALSPRGYVETLYRNVLDREGESAGVGYWTGRLISGELTKPEVLVAFAFSVENAETLAFIETLDEVEGGVWAFG